MTSKVQKGDDLGDRMKSLYETPETSRRFLPTLPVYARIDGRSFSKFTRGMVRPYDERMSNAMVETTCVLVEETHALIGYTQSDEISLVWQAPDIKSGIFFDGKIMKMASVLAGLATAAFHSVLIDHFPGEWAKLAAKLPHFDCRVVSLPSQVEAANMLLWRNIDATKNAVSMAAHHHFSHKSLMGMGRADMQERLFQEAGVNFNDYPEFFKRGTFVRRVTVERAFTDEELAAIPEKHRPAPDTMVTRSEVRTFPMPVFSKVMNRVGVIFDDEDPRLAVEPFQHDPTPAFLDGLREKFAGETTTEIAVMHLPSLDDVAAMAGHTVKTFNNASH